MKNFRKFASVLVVVVMALALGATAFAAQEGTLTGGSITIDNAVVGQTYNIYQILYIESYNSTTDAYSYKANSAWEVWLKTQTAYVTVDEQGYVTWVKNLTCKNTEEGHTHTDTCYAPADAAAFAKLAQAYATKIEEGKDTANVAANATATATTTEVKFESLKLGYYLVDSTLGTLCSLDTTNPSVTIKEKNAVPTNEKKVQEDSKAKDTDKGWGATNDADIGQTVSFQSTITAQTGAENYVFHDKMSAGLTYGSVTGITLNGTAVDTKYFTVKTTDLSDDCTFEVVFTQEFCDTLKANDKIVVSYTATLNEGAVVGLDGNKNESKLSYGDTSNTKSTTESETITYTWDVDVLKYANGDESKVLAGAEFVLLKKVDNVGYFAVVNSGKITGWTTAGVAPKENPEATKTYATVLTTGADGKIEIDGLDADTYYLREVKAPAGYNILDKDQEVKIEGATEVESEDGTKTLTYTTKVVKVNNQSGTELPSTGGMGTKVLYAIGALLVIGAGVLLVTKKRMSRSENG